MFELIAYALFQIFSITGTPAQDATSSAGGSSGWGGGIVANGGSSGWGGGIVANGGSSGWGGGIVAPTNK
ncbi:hypothetical protein [Hymenobacter sp. PAMC 26628]|uniref:hypothetical protein n=1 Tax=Hymenobacter sp. PAMC 26628 TaxID=1484118 RepID=UPI0007700A57|nr:hypothetical protein [Hymenobacter sp. PAMC 26628]AMJ66948.1 hypothetical protein AXW84_17070 [Hymenobacter sp. PAMC 26628]